MVAQRLCPDELMVFILENAQMGCFERFCGLVIRIKTIIFTKVFFESQHTTNNTLDWLIKTFPGFSYISNTSSIQCIIKSL